MGPRYTESNASTSKSEKKKQLGFNKWKKYFCRVWEYTYENKLIKTVLNVNFVNYFMNKSKIENKLEKNDICSRPNNKSLKIRLDSWNL